MEATLFAPTYKYSLQEWTISEAWSFWEDLQISASLEWKNALLPSDQKSAPSSAGAILQKAINYIL